MKEYLLVSVRIRVCLYSVHFANLQIQKFPLKILRSDFVIEGLGAEGYKERTQMIRLLCPFSSSEESSTKSNGQGSSMASKQKKLVYT